MKQVIILRGESTLEGTFGKLIVDQLQLFTLELPWNNDENNISCIPAGFYNCQYTLSPRLHKYTYEIFGDSKRTGIRMHSANFSSQLLGCIALGEKLGIMDGKKVLLISRPAVTKFEQYMKRKPFQMEVR